MSDERPTFNDFLQDIQQVFPDAAPNYIRRKVNEMAKQWALKHNLRRRETPMNTVADKQFYDLLILGSTKLFRVDLQDEDGVYIQIPQITDSDYLRKWDRD